MEDEKLPASKKAKVCATNAVDVKDVGAANIGFGQLSVDMIRDTILQYLPVHDVFSVCIACGNRFVRTPQYNVYGDPIQCVAKDMMHDAMDRGLDRTLSKMSGLFASCEKPRESFSTMANAMPSHSVEIVGSTIVQSILNKDWSKTSDMDVVCVSEAQREARSWMLQEAGLTLVDLEYGYMTEAAAGTQHDVDAIDHVEIYVATPEDGEKIIHTHEDDIYRCFVFSSKDATVPKHGMLLLLPEVESISNREEEEHRVLWLVEQGPQRDKNHELLVRRNHIDEGNTIYNPCISITALPGVALRVEPRLRGSVRKAASLTVLKPGFTIEEHKHRYDMEISKASFDGTKYIIPSEAIYGRTRLPFSVFKNYMMMNYFRLLEVQCQRTVLSITKQLYSGLVSVIGVRELNLDPEEPALVLFSPRYDGTVESASELSEYAQRAISWMRDRMLLNVEEPRWDDLRGIHNAVVERHNYMVGFLARIDRYVERGVRVCNAPNIHQNLRRLL